MWSENRALWPGSCHGTVAETQAGTGLGNRHGLGLPELSGGPQPGVGLVKGS